MAVMIIALLVDKARYDLAVKIIKDYERDHGRNATKTVTTIPLTIIEITNDKSFFSIWEEHIVPTFKKDLESDGRIIRVETTVLTNPRIKINKEYIPKDLANKYYIYLVYDINNKPKIITITPRTIKDF